jgi:macrolide-specific efflux system membrane fusion protein
MAKKRGGFMKPLFLIVAVAAIAGAGWYAFKARAAGGKDAGGVPTVTVAKGDIEDTVTAQGKLEPKEYVDVGTQVSGQLKKLYVDIGDTVKKGDLLAEIDPQVYQAKVAADQAALKSLQAQVGEKNASIKLAREQYARNEKLYKIQAISQDALQTAQSQLNVYLAQLSALNAQIEQQQSSLNGDEANLGYTKIYAPMDGTVVSQSTKEGQTVNASQTAPIIVQLANLDVMTVRAQVAEADIPRLKEGMPVYFTTLGSTRRWNATVRQILPTPETVNDVVLYDVLVDVDNKDRGLMTGMSTQMFFVVSSAKDVLTVPVAALGKHLTRKDNASGEAYRVTAMENGKPAPKVIYIGMQDRTNAEIKSGLSEGDVVALPVAQTASAQGQQKPGGGRGRMPRL